MIPLWWCRVAFLGVLVLQPLWFAWLAPPSVLPMAFVLAVTILPMLVVLPGVLRLRTRPLVIAGCLLMFYFSFAVMEAWAHPAVRIQSIVQILLVTLYFTALPSVRQPRRENG